MSDHTQGYHLGGTRSTKPYGPEDTEPARAVFCEVTLTRAILDNVREEIRPEVEYALQLASAGSRHPVASDGEAASLRPNQTSLPVDGGVR